MISSQLDQHFTQSQFISQLISINSHVNPFIHPNSYSLLPLLPNPSQSQHCFENSCKQSTIRVDLNPAITESTHCIPLGKQICLQQCNLNFIKTQCQPACQPICQQNCGHRQLQHQHQQQRQQHHQQQKPTTTAQQQ
ncbi:unnamed protein product [Onchocerca flexuosa]|uniref:ShKT domain-containing protein n=1 Tax=Onchocerca flexuosa TaxID=387005 RepID=A0A183H1C2_9BILA|nr:unnamed protein product [Onchocerca flexuosa]